MTNNALLDRLMGNNTQDKSSLPTSSNQSNILPTLIIEDEATTIRVVSVKYKIYIAVILMIMVYIGMNYYPGLQKHYDNTQAQKQTFTQEINRLKAEQEQLKEDQAFMNDIITEESHLEECLNDGDGCRDLIKKRSGGETEEMKRCQTENYDDETYTEDNCKDLMMRWEKVLAIPISFSQIHSLHAKNMIIDEKKILRNLNEYLIQDKFEMGLESRNGSIRSVHIGNPIEEDEKGVFFSVPISFTIVFNNQANLISFVHNVEKKLIEDEEDRILYKIQTISYDIVEGEEEQTSTLELIAYYYYNPALDSSTFEDSGENNAENND